MTDRPVPCTCGCNGDSIELEEVARLWLHDAIAFAQTADGPLPSAVACAQIAEAAITIAAASHMRDATRQQIDIMRRIDDQD